MLRVLRLLAPNPGVFTLDGTNTWIVGGDPSIVIDPGPDLPEHLEAVAQEAAPVAAVLVTHDHPDHAPGAAALAAMVDAPVLAFRLAGAGRLRADQRIRGGDVELTAVHTPGHTSDHVAFFEASSGSLFTGDAVVGRGTSFVDPPDGHLLRYLRSLQRMLDLDPRTIYPGHGPVILRAKDKLLEDLSHRQERERQVLAALGEGPKTIPELVVAIYSDYPTDVRLLAARSLLAHLLKLEHEGRAIRSGKGEDGPWSASTPRTCERCGRRVTGRARYCSSCSLAILQGED